MWQFQSSEKERRGGGGCRNLSTARNVVQPVAKILTMKIYSVSHLPLQVVRKELSLGCTNWHEFYPQNGSTVTSKI